MIVILKHGVTDEKRDKLIEWFHGQGLGVDISKGEYQTILGLIGDVLNLDTDLIESLDIVQATRRVTEPFKRCTRKFHPDDTIIKAGDVLVGGGNFAMFAGPSSIESEEQIVGIARQVKAAGANVLIGGAIKPRTAAYTIQNQGLRDIELLKVAREETGLPIAKEILSVEDLPKFKDIDIIVVGARNMYNFPLLCELGSMDKTIILKRAVSAGLEDFLMAAEYVMVGGNKNIILCERGIRTFSDYTKATLDISSVPMLHELTHLPVIVDPSRGTGIGRLTKSMARAAAAAGADGLMIDVHNDPSQALFNGAQAVPTEEFTEIAADVRAIRELLK